MILSETAPVKHGFWIHYDDVPCFLDECSECNHLVHICADEDAGIACICKRPRHLMNYCPVCGAKMDKEDDYNG